MRTLMVLNGPGIRAGQKLTNVRIIDFAPTLAWLLDFPRPKDATGKVLYEAFVDSPRRHRQSSLTPSSKIAPWETFSCFNASWEPPAVVSLDRNAQSQRQVTTMPVRRFDISEDIFRIDELDMDWDIGVVVYEPQRRRNSPPAPTARKSASSCSTAAFPISNRSNASRACWQVSSASKSRP